MLFEFCGGVVIKVQIKGFLKNLTEKEEEIIDTSGIKKTNIISYITKDAINKITIDKNKVILQRENNEFSHEIIFEKDKITKSEYFLKDLHHSLEFNIETQNLITTENKINVTYKIKETENIYNYVIELSDKI